MDWNLLRKYPLRKWLSFFVLFFSHVTKTEKTAGHGGHGNEVAVFPVPSGRTRKDTDVHGRTNDGHGKTPENMSKCPENMAKNSKNIRFPCVFTCRIKGAPAKLKVAPGYSATEIKNSTLRLTGKRSKTIGFPYVFAGRVKSSWSN